MGCCSSGPQAGLGLGQRRDVLLDATLHYPMYVLSFGALMRLQRMEPHQELLAAGAPSQMLYGGHHWGGVGSEGYGTKDWDNTVRLCALTTYTYVLSRVFVYALALFLSFL